MVKASIKGTRETTVMVPAEMEVMMSLKMGSLAMMWKSGSSFFPFFLQIVTSNEPTTNEHFIARHWYMLDIVQCFPLAFDLLQQITVHSIVLEMM